ncbi:Ferric reductase transmembrane component 1 [Termitomyces sp. T112]|nr:Ferric reductase transmembrane component 1 [Termitomyces sp. T112]
MSDTGTPPVIPADLQQYDSYEIDPKWQVKFTIIWTTALALFALITLPSILRGCRRWMEELFGITENWHDKYTRVGDEKKESYFGGGLLLPPRPKRVIVARILSTMGSVFYWTPPGIGLNVGQMILIAGYAAVVVVCICTSAELVTNPNRAGFLVLAQLTPVFLFSSKNTALSLLLPPFFAYTRLNVLHRWASRTLFLAALLHGSLWINNHLVWDIQILGQQKETSGVAAFGVLCAIVLTSLRPVRAWAWGIFYWVHFLAVPAFFITVCYHTIYAPPWIFPPIAIYAFDLLMRAGRFRLKDARLVPVDDEMTIIHIPDCDGGFQAGQHLRLRVFFGGRMFESHPLSIISAPSSSSGSTTCLTAADMDAYYRSDCNSLIIQASANESGTVQGPGILLGARAVGDWTKALNKHARDWIRESVIVNDKDENVTGAPSMTKVRKVMPMSVPVHVLFDGPYGGCSIDLWTFDRVLLVAGGSGATFAIGCMDALVALCARPPPPGLHAPRTRKIHFVWCMRSFGYLNWFAPLLRAIARTAAAASVRLTMTAYVTCMCSPEEVDVPGLVVRIGGRPDVSRLVRGVAVGHIGTTTRGSEEDLCTCGCVDEALKAQEEDEDEESLAGDVEKGKGVVRGQKQESVGVCASGPETMIREATNAVAGYAVEGREVGFHAEVFAM